MRSEGLMEFSVGAKWNTEHHQTETECRPAKTGARTYVLPTKGDKVVYAIKGDSVKR